MQDLAYKHNTSVETTRFSNFKLGKPKCEMMWINILWSIASL